MESALIVMGKMIEDHPSLTAAMDCRSASCFKENAINSVVNQVKDALAFGGCYTVLTLNVKSAFNSAN